MRSICTRLAVVGLVIGSVIGFATFKANAQTPEVRVIFKVNEKTVEVPSFTATIFDPGSKKTLFELETTEDGLMKVPKGLANVPKFDVEIAFLKYDLRFPDFTIGHMDNEWVIDVSDPVDPTPFYRKGKKTRVTAQYLITFHPLDREGTNELITLFDH